MQPPKERVLEELARIAAGDARGAQGAFEETMRSERLRRAHATLATAIRRRARHSAYDTGSGQPIEAPPAWLPPVG